MNIPLVLNYLRPNESWSLDGNTYSGLVWLDVTEKPTEAELKAVASKAEAADKAKIANKVAARTSALAKLSALGLTRAEIEAL
jgi:hypothetical protein